ncbi:hypothetical protein BJ322DRAFT_1041722 [Thelephora terrestris]|uniref:Uncharacterized protein n=1 Tax=Thelephora terrestris TaxID=56493 RepID=A0A9P6HNG3_9AGAM|nr:hypothetical protein BJ322DRAFT_1041722 [Thelephora terrestris]
MPIIQHCFGHLSPNLRFLALKEPKGTCRQLLYFIGLFPNLQDLKLHCCRSIGELKAPADATLIPLSTPPLRGWLRLICFKEDEIVKDMVTLFGGLRFRYLDLAEVSCTQLLLYECAGALETLRLYPTGDSHVNHHARQDLDLSQNKSLRTLETTVGLMDLSHLRALQFPKTVPSFIPTLDVIITYRDCDFGGWGCRGFGPKAYFTSGENYLQGIYSGFRVLREMYSMQEFRLVFCADVSDDNILRALQELEIMVRREEARGAFDYLRYRPIVIFERRMLGILAGGWDRGSWMEILVASAL